MSLPSRLAYSPLLRDSDSDGADKVSDDPGRIEVVPGRLDGRRVPGRDLGVVVLGRDVVDFGLAVSDFCSDAEVPPDAEVCMVMLSGFAADRVRDAVLREPAEPAAEPPSPADLDVRDAARELGRVDADLVDADRGLAAGLRAAAVRDVAAVRRAGAAAATGFAADIVLAAAVRAFAAVVIALVAVFIARMADDIVLADAVALVAAAVILVAADVTLVAADDTVLAATAGVAEPRVVVARRAVVARPVVLRLVVVALRAAVVRVPVERDAVDRVAALRVAREVVLRAGEAWPAADVAAVPRVALGEVPDDLELDVDCGRLAVPLDALRLTDLLRAVLAEPRRVAARVVD